MRGKETVCRICLQASVNNVLECGQDRHVGATDRFRIFFEDRGCKLPVIVSGTITDLSGRTLTGQTVEAFLTSILHAEPLVVGLNCALGPTEMRPYVEEMARLAPCYVSAYPNAGLPDPLSTTGFPETPESMASLLRDWASNGWLNIVGGCCGTTPAHIRAIAAAVRDCPPRVILSEAMGRARDAEALLQTVA